METIERTYKLPSNGYFGGPKEVTIRPMSTKEEKILYASKDYGFINKIVENCVVEPKDFTLDNLHESDILFLLYMIRELTFGPTYYQSGNCPDCGFKQDIEINITDMSYNILDTEGLEEKLTVDLPVSKDTLVITLLSHKDIVEIDNYVKRLTRRGELQDPESYQYVLTFARMIQTKNGEEFKEERAKIDYLNNLHMADFAAIKDVLSDIKIGLDLRVYYDCSNCGGEEEVFGTICPEFFRPSKH